MSKDSSITDDGSRDLHAGAASYYSNALGMREALRVQCKENHVSLHVIGQNVALPQLSEAVHALHSRSQYPEIEVRYNAFATN